MVVHEGAGSSIGLAPFPPKAANTEYIAPPLDALAAETALGMLATMRLDDMPTSFAERLREEQLLSAEHARGPLYALALRQVVEADRAAEIFTVPTFVEAAPSEDPEEWIRGRETNLANWRDAVLADLGMVVLHAPDETIVVTDDFHAKDSLDYATVTARLDAWAGNHAPDQGDHWSRPITEGTVEKWAARHHVDYGDTKWSTTTNKDGLPYRNMK